MSKLNVYQKITVTIFIVILLSEIIIYSHLFIRTPDFDILSANESIINYKISAGSYPSDLQVAFLELNNPPSTKSIYIYYDSDYQIAGTGIKEASGLVDHLQAEMKTRKYEKNIEVINASELSTFLLDTQAAKNSILVITSGAFPDTVFSLNKNIVKPWIETGGTLFWIGDVFAYYSAEKSDKALYWRANIHPKDYGAVNFFGTNNIIIRSKAEDIALDDSVYSQALNLSYAYVNYGVSLDFINSRNGKVLGKIGDKSTSIAVIPLANGNIIIFGGPDRNEWIVAKDIAQIIFSGILENNIITSRVYSLERNQEITDNLHLNESSIQDKGKIYGIRAYAFQASETPTFFKIFDININNTS